MPNEGYKFVKGPTSDVKFEAYGKSLNELFENAALAVSSVMCDVRKVKARKVVEVAIEGRDSQDLLFDWINQVIALVDINGMFFSKFKVNVSGKSLKAECYGEEAKPENSLTVVKSATYHEFKLGNSGDGWKATIVLDI